MCEIGSCLGNSRKLAFKQLRVGSLRACRKCRSYRVSRWFARKPRRLSRPTVKGWFVGRRGDGLVVATTLLFYARRRVSHRLSTSVHSGWFAGKFFYFRDRKNLTYRPSRGAFKRNHALLRVSESLRNRANHTVLIKYTLPVEILERTFPRAFTKALGEVNENYERPSNVYLPNDHKKPGGVPRKRICVTRIDLSFWTHYSSLHYCSTISIIQIW